MSAGASITAQPAQGKGWQRDLIGIAVTDASALIWLCP